jgi:hypothetical protein
MQRALDRQPRQSRSTKILKLLVVHPDLASPATLFAAAQDVHPDLLRKSLALGVSPRSRDDDGATRTLWCFFLLKMS